MKKVIVINGTALSGKDTYADEFIKYSDKFNKHSYKRSTVDKIKEDCFKIFGANPKDKSDKNRKLWCDYKKLCTDFNDSPFRDIVDFIDAFSFGDYFFVFAREPNEIQKLKDFYKECCLTILIKRDGLLIPENFADLNVDDFDYDMYIKNESLEGLLQSARNLFNELNGV